MRRFILYVVSYVDQKGTVQENQVETFRAANQFARSIREFCPNVSVTKVGSPARKWDVYLFAPELPVPKLIQSNVRTYVAKLTWTTWDHREHHAVIVCWPNDLPLPSTWFSSF